MLIFPAIDMIDGNVVRLFQGDYTKQETYGTNPLEFAKKFEQQGAKYLHLVDLDGAKQGSLQNFEIAKKIAANTNLLVELGGGIRDEQAVEQCIKAGIGRVILGTSALKNPSFVKKMVGMYKEKIAVGVDARDGKVAIEGWLDTSQVDSLDFCKEMQQIGVRYIIYTDISKDGAGTGVNLPIYEKLANLSQVNITASGGVTTLEDISSLKELGLYAAILGKALYTNKIELEQAIALAGKQM